MKIELKISLDKNKELDLEYGKSIDLAFISYNMMKQLDSSLPDISCESVESDDTIVYNLNLGTIDLTSDDIKVIWDNALKDYSAYDKNT